MKAIASQSVRNGLLGVVVLVAAVLYTASAEAGLNCRLPRCEERDILSADGTTHIIARDWGTKYKSRPTLLLLHGYPHSQDAWVKQIKSDLRRKYRLITMDLRGMGESTKYSDPNKFTSHLLAEDVDAVLGAGGFNVQKAVIVAHSYGAAPVIAYLAINGTSKIAGLVAVAPAHAGVSGLNITTEAFNLFVFQFNPPSYEAFVQSNKDFLKMSYAPQIGPKGQAKNLLAQDLLVPPDVRFAILTAPQEAPPAAVEAFMSGLETVNGVQVLFVIGAGDAVVKPSSIDYLNTLVVGSQKIVYPNHGHLLQLTNDNQFNQDLKTFVDGLNLTCTMYDTDPDDDDDD